jgi:hypothetical protein
MVTSPNMSLQIATPGSTGGIGNAPTGQDYATQTSNSLTIIDAHSHLPGSGVPITTGAININGDLTFNAFNVTNQRASRFISQAATLALPSDVLQIYVSNNNLYYNNASGTPVQITNGSSLAGGGSSGNSLLYSYLAVSANKTILSTDVISYFDVNTGSSAITFTLPQASAIAAGTYYIFKDASANASSNNITINVASGSGNQIDGSSSYIIKQNNGCVVLISDGSSHFRVERLDALSINGVSINGAATTNYVLTAANSSGASWQPLPATTVISGITVSGTPSIGQVLTATSTAAADWQTPSGGGGGGYTSTTGDVTSSGSGAVATTVVSATGSSGNFAINCAKITNQIASNEGTVTNVQSVTTSSTSPNTTTVYAVPSGSCARVDVTITGRNGANAVQQTWSGKVVNNGGTLTVFKAFAPIDALDSNGTNPATSVSVQNSTTNITVTVTASGSTSTNWTYVTCVTSSA